MKERDYNLIKKLLEDVRCNKIEFDFKSNLSTIIEDLSIGIGIHMLEVYNCSPCDGGVIEFIIPTLAIYKLEKSEVGKYYLGRIIFKLEGNKMPPDYNPLKIDFSYDDISIDHLYKLAYVKCKNKEQKNIDEIFKKIMLY